MNRENNSGRFFPARISFGQDALWIASIALIYFATARLSLLLVFQPVGIAAIWPPTGVFLSAILLTRRDLRPWLAGTLFITDFIAERLAGTPFLVSAIYALALTGDAVVSVWLLHRYVGEPFTFRRVRDVAGWFVLSVLLSNALVALAAAAASELLPGTHSFWSSWQWWAASDGVGNLLVTPFILGSAGWTRIRLRAWNWPRVFEGAALFIPLALVNFALFSYFSKHQLGALFLPYVTFPFLLWAALRFGVRGAVTALLTVAAIVIPFTASGRIPSFSFAPGVLDEVLAVQLFLALMAVPALFMAAVVTERKRTEEALQERAKLAALEADVGTALTRDGTFAEMLRLCSEAIVRHLDGAFARIWTLNEREKMLELQASAGMYTHLNGPHGRVPVGKFKVGLIAEERKPHLTNQVVGDPRIGDQEWAKREGMVAFAGYPLLVEDRLVGVVATFACHTLTDRTLQTLASISNNIAVGIERKRAAEELQWKTALLEAQVNSSLDGILVVDQQGKKILQNQRTADLLKIPQHILDDEDDETQRRWVAGMAKNPEQFVEKVAYLYSHPNEIGRDETEFKDGTILDRYSSPVVGKDGKYYGRIWTLRDITARKQAETALRASEERFRIAAETANDVVYEWDLKQSVEWLGKIDEMLGYEPGEFPRTLNGWAASVHPEDLERTMAAIQAHLEGRVPFAIEYRVRRKDGVYRWWSARGAVARTPDGKPTRWIGSITDFTERKQAEERLTQEHDLSEAILNNMPGLFYLITEKGRFLRWNRQLETVSGYSGEEIARMHPLDIFPAEHKGLVAEQILQVFKTGRSKVEANLLTKQGEQLPFYFTGGTVIVDGQPCLAGTGIDITERKRTETALRESDARYRALFNESADGILIADIETKTFKYANPALCRMLGYTEDELRTMGVLDIHPKDAVQSVVAEFEAQTRGDETLAMDIPCLRKDGSVVYADINGGRITIDDRPCNVGFFRDITERKRAQAELENIHKQLVEASRRGGMAEIATNVLHNVGNVLNSVNISTGLIVESVKKFRASSLARVVVLLQEHAHDLGEFITNDSGGKHVPAHLARLSEHLMADQEAIVGELDSLRRNVEHIKEIVAMQQNYAMVGGVKEMINVVNLVEDSLRINESALSRHRLEVIREFETVPPMNVEKQKILQILVNLVSNAKYACEESGRADKRLTVRVANGDGRVKISIIDNGIGIPPENLTRIFNHGFTTRKDGHGFGLHSGALAAKEMGGSLSVHSDGPGQGAAFTLELPCPARGNTHE